MRVLHINIANGIRSTGRVCSEISEYLDSKGHESFIAYSYGHPSTNSYKIGSKLEKKIHSFFSRLTGLQGYYSKKGTKSLIRYILEVKPDIIHIHNVHGNYINLPLLFQFLSEKDIATVITLHDCWFFTGGHLHFFSDSYFDWKRGYDFITNDKTLVGNKSWFFDRSEKILNDQYHWFSSVPRIALVGVSNWITNEARNSKATYKVNIVTIRNWIDNDIFKPVNSEEVRKKLSVENKYIILGVASTWSIKKGIKEFIELSKNISEDQVIILVGKIAQKTKLPSNIINISETHDAHELARYYSMADVFVNLSAEESFGKVAAEALACGTPVITLNTTANPEIIERQGGIVISDYNIMNLLESINTMRMKNKNQYSDVCTNLVNKNFRKDMRIEDYINLYKELIESDKVV